MSEISIKNASIINASSKYISIILSLVFVGILSRILTPEQYGIMSVVVIFTNFFSILTDLGIGTGIIQNKTLNDEDVKSLFGASFWMGIIFSLIFICVSFLVSYIYNDVNYIYIFLMLVVSIMFNSLNIVPNALLLKQKKFITIGLRTIIINLIVGTLTVASAIFGFGYYALVLQSILLSVLTFFWNYFSNRINIKIFPNVNSINKIKSYSGYHFAFNIMNYFARNLDSLLVGRNLSEVDLAYYNKSYTLMMYPISNLTFVITPILHPILSDFQDDKDKIYSSYMKVLKFLSLLGVYITIFSFFAAKELILIVFGDQWVNSIQSFQYLAISIYFQMTASTAGSIYLSLGNTKLMFKSGLVFTAITITASIIGVIFGTIEMVALFVGISFILKYFIEFIIIIGVGFKKSIFHFFKSFFPELIIAIIMSISILFSNVIIIDNLIFSALFKLVVASISFLIGLIITKQVKHLLVLFPSKIQNKIGKIFRINL